MLANLLVLQLSACMCSFASWATCSFRISFPTESLQPESACRQLTSEDSLDQHSLQQDQLVAAYSSSFKQPSLQQEELGSAYSRRSFQQHSFQQESLLQDELAATQLQSPTRASQLSSFEEIEPLESFIHQLDLEISLSFPGFSKTQLQPDSFGRSSFENRALPCAALLESTNSNRQLQNRSVQSFQLTRIQLRGLVQGGAFNPTLQTRASSPCCPPLHCTALTLSSLSLAINAWLKPTSLRACRGRPLRRSLCTTSLSTTSSTKQLQRQLFQQHLSEQQVA